MGYYNIKLDSDAKKLCTIVTHFGKYQYLRLPIGKVAWEVQYLYDVKRIITAMAYYIPTVNIRLFSPKFYFDEQHGGSYHMERGMTRSTLGDGTTLTFPYQQGSKLSMMLKSSQIPTCWPT
jgi:hypothetical protein